MTENRQENGKEKERLEQTVLIQPAKADDIVNVVEVHALAFPEFFLTLMGKRFIREYYSVVISYPESIFLVARGMSGSIIGFVSGYKNANGFYSYYGERRYKLAFLILIAVLRRPSLFGRVVRNILRVNNASSARGNDDDIELSSLGVLPEYQGYGYGKRLMDEFLGHAKNVGAKAVYLTTDAVGNENVNRFYQARGFYLEDTSVEKDRLKNIFRYNVDQGS